MRMLKIQSLDKRWHDRDEILLHTTFQVLVDFIEKERPDRVIDWSSDEIHKHAWREMRALYKWWTEVRPARRSPLDTILSRYGIHRKETGCNTTPRCRLSEKKMDFTLSSSSDEDKSADIVLQQKRSC
jgi:hypothetical protein